MIDIKKYEIWLTRGDSAYIAFDLRTATGEPVELTAYDNIRCQVRDAKLDGALIFEGEIQRSDNKFTWHIRPEDTTGLELGEYYWDAQIEYINGDIFTFVPVSKFIILPEVTIKET